MTVTFEEINTYLRQRLPLIMVDRVLEVEPGKRTKAIKNVTGNEIRFLDLLIPASAGETAARGGAALRVEVDQRSPAVRDTSPIGYVHKTNTCIY